MTAIETWIYQDEEVRTLLIDGEPCFIANDLCDVLEIRNARDAVSTLDEDEKGVVTADTLGGAQQMAYVTEAGMYSLVLRSRKPEAKAFKRWLTHEVLPAIRKTGQYQRPMSLAERTMALMGELQAQVDEQARQLEAARPKIEYVETFVADEDLLTLRTIASDLKVGEQELRALLISKKWIYQQTSTRWSEKAQKLVPMYRYSAMADKKQYFQAVLAHDAPRFKGEVMHTLKVTAAGAAAIARLLASLRRSADLLETSGVAS